MKKLIKDITQDYRRASGVPYWKLIQIQEEGKVIFGQNSLLAHLSCRADEVSL